MVRASCGAPPDGGADSESIEGVTKLIYGYLGGSWTAPDLRGSGVRLTHAHPPGCPKKFKAMWQGQPVLKFAIKVRPDCGAARVETTPEPCFSGTFPGHVPPARISSLASMCAYSASAGQVWLRFVCWSQNLNTLLSLPSKNARPSRGCYLWRGAISSLAYMRACSASAGQVWLRQRALPPLLEQRHGPAADYRGARARRHVQVRNQPASSRVLPWC